MTIHIRQAQIDDLPALLALGNVTEAGYFERCFEEQGAGKRAIWVATKDNKIAGYVFVNLNPRYQPFRRLNIPEIQDLYVSPDARRQGMGEALVKFCEDHARAQGANQMGMAVGLHHGFGSAQRLYVRMGYVPDGAGIMHDRNAVRVGEMRTIDDDLTLMMIKDI